MVLFYSQKTLYLLFQLNNVYGFLVQIVYPKRQYVLNKLLFQHERYFTLTSDK